MKRFLLLLLMIIFPKLLPALETASAYKGRIRPTEAYARLWLYDFYHNQSIKPKHAQAFQATSAQELLWKMNFLGHSPWDKAPLFWIHYAKLKQILGLTQSEDYFSYNQLSQALYGDKESNLRLVKPLLAYQFIKAYLDPTNRSRSEKIELTSIAPGLWLKWVDNNIIVIAIPQGVFWKFLKPEMVILSNAPKQLSSYLNEQRMITEEALTLISLIQQYEAIAPPPTNALLSTQLLPLQHSKQSPKEIALSLESQFPLRERIEKSGPLLKILPGARGEWYPLNALHLQTYDAKQNTLVAIPNFTLFSDELFVEIRHAYLALKNDLSEDNIENLKHLLQKGYEALEGKPYKQATNKTLVYPSITQLQAEKFYYQYPLIEIAIVLYAMGLVVGALTYAKHPNLTFTLLLIAFVFHSLILCLRCFILQRPPVSNMFETVIYVPWIAVLTGLLLWLKYRNSTLLFSAAFSAIALLLLLKVSYLSANLENVQAVLDSQYWLLVHVLMVVGSYGAFILSGIIGHCYLLSYWKHNKETEENKFLSKIILQSLYFGVALLIPGTILGGVWAAESWGRFWDWDPKESWAFISCCTYLIGIHAYRFHYIHHFGLALCSIIGLMIISFTWYGVNYILGTGLHSYGFGFGGEIYYYGYLLIEVLFLSFLSIPKRIQKLGV